MARSEDWDAQKTFDQYIHDYMVRNNLPTAAEIFAKEANVGAESIVKEEPNGFLKDWWNMFWDSYSSRMPEHLEAMEGSSAKAAQVMGNEQLNHFHGNPGSDNMLLRPLEARLFAAKIHEGEHCGLPAREMNFKQQLGVDNPVHSSPSSSNASNSRLQTHVGDQRWTAGGNYGTHMGSCSHMGSTFNGAQENMLPRSGHPGAEGLFISRTRKSANSTQLNGGPFTGTGRIPSEMEFPVLNSFVPPPNQLSWFQTPIPHHQQEMSSQAMENAKGKQISYFQGSTNSLGIQMFPTNCLNGTDRQMMTRQTAQQQMIILNPKKQAVEQKMAGPVGISLEQKQKNRLLRQKLREDQKRRKRKNLLKSQSKNEVLNGTNAEVKKSLDDDIESHFSPDNANADIVSTSFDNLKKHSTAFSLAEESGFFFKEVASLKPSKGKILCCDFSSDGTLVASAGDDQKVFLWNMTSYESVLCAEGHSDSISDVRFKPNSHLFATSSFDATVLIWDSNSASEPLGKLLEPLGKLLGHSGQVNSLDFHPNGDILCSCDSNDEIKLWTIDEFACTHTIKGATRQVRFQPRFGTLLAAASGNGISLFDVETNTLQYSLEGHVNEIKSICWDTSGKYMASVSKESVRVWSIGYGGKCVHELQSNDNKFESCTFHPAYSNILIIGSNQSLELWNSIESNKTLTVPAHNGVVAALGDCTETKMVASASHDQCIKIWK